MGSNDTNSRRFTVANPTKDMVDMAWSNLTTPESLRTFQRLIGVPATGPFDARTLGSIEFLTTEGLQFTANGRLINLVEYDATGAGDFTAGTAAQLDAARAADRPRLLGTIYETTNRLSALIGDDGQVPNTVQAQGLVVNLQLQLERLNPGVNNLRITGQMDAATLALLNPALTQYAIQQSAESAYSIILDPSKLVDSDNPRSFNTQNVAILQSNMRVLGLYTGEPTGQMDAQTMAGVNQLVARLPRQTLESMNQNTAQIIRSAVELNKDHGSDNPNITTPSLFALEVYGVQFGLTESVDGRRDMVMMRDIENDFKIRTDQILGARDVTGFVNNLFIGTGTLVRDGVAMENGVRGAVTAWGDLAQGAANGTYDLGNLGISGLVLAGGVLSLNPRTWDNTTRTFRTIDQFGNTAPILSNVLNGDAAALTGDRRSDAQLAAAQNTIGLVGNLGAPVPPVIGLGRGIMRGLDAAADATRVADNAAPVFNAAAGNAPNPAAPAPAVVDAPPIITVVNADGTRTVTQNGIVMAELPPAPVATQARELETVGAAQPTTAASSPTTTPSSGARPGQGGYPSTETPGWVGRDEFTPGAGRNERMLGGEPRNPYAENPSVAYATNNGPTPDPTPPSAGSAARGATGDTQAAAAAADAPAAAPVVSPELAIRIKALGLTPEEFYTIPPLERAQLMRGGENQMLPNSQASGQPRPLSASEELALLNQQLANRDITQAQFRARERAILNPPKSSEGWASKLVAVTGGVLFAGTAVFAVGSIAPNMFDPRGTGTGLRALFVAADKSPVPIGQTSNEELDKRLDGPAEWIYGRMMSSSDYAITVIKDVYGLQVPPTKDQIPDISYLQGLSNRPQVGGDRDDKSAAQQFINEQVRVAAEAQAAQQELAKASAERLQQEAATATQEAEAARAEGASNTRQRIIDNSRNGEWNFTPR